MRKDNQDDNFDEYVEKKRLRSNRFTGWGNIFGSILILIIIIKIFSPTDIRDGIMQYWPFFILFLIILFFFIIGLRLVSMTSDEEESIRLYKNRVKITFIALGIISISIIVYLWINGWLKW